MKIFRMNDSDWYAAETVEDALRCMAETMDYETTPEGIAEMCEDHGVEDPQGLGDEELDRTVFREMAEDEVAVERELSYRAKLTEMIAAGDEFPCLFATTEF